MSYSTVGQVLGKSSGFRGSDGKEWKMLYPKKKGYVSTEEASIVAKHLGISLTSNELEQLRKGMIVELEHGKYAKCDRCSHSIDVTGDELHLTGMIALAHLSEMSDYYVKLEEMEEQGKEE